MPYFLLQRLRESMDKLLLLRDRLVSDSCLHRKDHTWLAVSLQKKICTVTLQVEQSGALHSSAFINYTAFPTCTETIRLFLGVVATPAS